METRTPEKMLALPILVLLGPLLHSHPDTETSTKTTITKGSNISQITIRYRDMIDNQQISTNET